MCNNLTGLGWLRKALKIRGVGDIERYGDGHPPSTPLTVDRMDTTYIASGPSLSFRCGLLFDLLAFVINANVDFLSSEL